MNHVRCVRGGAVKAVTSGPPPAGFIERFDRDGDDKVSRAEFDGPERRFAVLDANGDGFIDGDEAPKGPPRRDGPRGRGGRAPTGTQSPPLPGHVVPLEVEEPTAP